MNTIVSDRDVELGTPRNKINVHPADSEYNSQSKVALKVKPHSI